MKIMKIPVAWLSLMLVMGLAGAVRAATECYTNTVYFGWAGWIQPGNTSRCFLQ